MLKMTTSKLCWFHGFDLIGNNSLSFLFVMKSICQPANSAKNLQKNTKFHVILLLDWQYTDNKTISFH